MFLAGAWAKYPTEVRADLQRYYGINIERIGQEYSIWHIAACLVSLPLGSKLFAAVEPEAQYTTEQRLLHIIVNLFSSERLPYPWEIETEAVEDFEAVDIEEFNKWRNQSSWEEVKNQWQILQ